MSVGGTGGADYSARIKELTKDRKEDAQADKAARQAETKESGEAFQARGGTAAMKGKQRKTTKRGLKDIVKAVIKRLKTEKGENDQGAEENAQKLQDTNHELKKDTLMSIRDEAKKKGSNPEDILDLVERYYPNDPSLADEALDFLESNLPKDIKKNVTKAKNLLNQTKGKEVARGRASGAFARAISKKVAQTPTALRDEYMDLAHPKTESDPHDQFRALIGKYKDPEVLKNVIDFFFQSAGADLKAGGPNIEPGRLKNLMSEIQTLQGLTGSFQLFDSRKNQMQAQLKKAFINTSPDCTPHNITKMFLELASQRYPSTDSLREKIGDFMDVDQSPMDVD